MLRSFDLESQWKAEAQTGNDLKFELCKGGYFSDQDEYGLKVVGKTDQRQLSGKNLFDEKTRNGYYDESTGEFKTYTLYLANVNEILVDETKQYYINVDCKISMYDSSLNHIRTFAVTDNIVTLDAGTKFVNFRTLQNYGQVYKSDIIFAEYKSTATEYEPYCGGIPSPNPEYPQDIQCVEGYEEHEVVGKNLFNGTWHKGNLQPITGEVLYGGQNDNFAYSDFIPATNNQAYTTHILEGTCEYFINLAMYSEASLDSYIGMFSAEDKNINPRTYTVNNSEIKYIVLRIKNTTENWLDDVPCQLELGSTATEYEPYHKELVRTGGTKVRIVPKNLLNVFRDKGELVGNSNSSIRQFDESKYYIGISASNFYNPSTIENHDITQSGDVTVTSNNMYFGLGFPVKVYPNTKYKIFCIPTGSIGQLTVEFSFYTADGVFIRNSSNINNIFTTPDNCYWLNIVLRAATAYETAKYRQVQLIENPKVNVYYRYEPYFEPREITIPCDLYEGDIYYPMSGKVVRWNDKVTLSADYDYGIYTYRMTNGITVRRCLKETLHRVAGYCTNAIVVEEKDVELWLNKLSMWVGVSDTNIRWIAILDHLNLTSAEEFVEWIVEQQQSGNPVEVVYKLATPIIEQKDEWKQPLFAPSGTAIVTQEPTDLEADLSATMLVHR